MEPRTFNDTIEETKRRYRKDIALSVHNVSRELGSIDLSVFLLGMARLFESRAKHEMEKN